MERSIYRISLDIRDSIGACQPEMKQGDTHRRLCIDLTDGGMPYPIGDGCRVVFTAKKPDGTVIHNTCAVENNTVIYDITPQTTSAAGILNCELQLYDGTAEPLALITSAAFRIRVHPRVYNETDIPASEVESTGLSALLCQAQQLLDRLERVWETGEFGGISIAKLCPPFSEAGTVIRCRPVESYPLEVTSRMLPTLEGHSTVTLTQLGKNLYDKDAYPFTGNYVHHGMGSMHASTTCCGTKDFIPVAHLAGQTVTLNHPPKEVGAGNPGTAFYDKDQVYITGYNDYTMTVPENAAYMRFSVPLAYLDGAGVQLELGSSVTDYAPYTQKTYTLTPEESCYGGTLDWGAGVITVTHKAIPLNQLQWHWHEINCCFYADLPEGRVPVDGEETDTLCSFAKWDPGTYDDIMTGGTGDRVYDIAQTEGGCRIVVVSEAYGEQAFIQQLTEADAWLLYPLAEPVSVECGKQKIVALPGTNTLFGSTDSLQVMGRGDPVAILEAHENAILSLGGNI